MAGRREHESGSHQPATTRQGQAASICGDRRRSRPAPRHPRPMPSAEDRGAEGQGSRLRFRRLPRARRLPRVAPPPPRPARPRRASWPGSARSGARGPVSCCGRRPVSRASTGGVNATSTSPSSSAEAPRRRHPLHPDGCYGPTTTSTRDLHRGRETTHICVPARLERRMGASFASFVGA
jgi:hypothetical protein